MANGPGYQEYPDHKLELHRPERRVRMQYHGKFLAETSSAVVVDESKHKPVYYTPRQDVDMSRLVKSGKEYDCPFKGHATYFSLEAGDEREDDVAWSYEQTYDEMKDIDSYIAFDQNKVEVIELEEGRS